MHELVLGVVHRQHRRDRMLEHVAFFNPQTLRATKHLRALSASPTYREQFRLLRTIPGVGLLTAMEILLELGDMSRFSNAEKLAAGCPLGGLA